MGDIYEKIYWKDGKPYNAWGREVDLSKPVPGFGTWDSREIWFQTVDSTTPTTSGTAPPPVASVVTGIDPSEISSALYGKVIALSAFGLARWGTCGLIFGPYISGGTGTFAVSFGFPANVTGTRRVYEVALDGKIAWENAAGSPAGALGSGFIGDPFTCRFYAGTQTQGADPLEVAEFGAKAVAYRPQMMLWFDQLPLAAFDDKIPFVSAKIGDVTDSAVPEEGINLGEALTRFATSPWLEYSPSTFATTGVADIVQAMILTEDITFLELLRTTSRVYRTLDILQTDKLRVVDRGATVSPDLVLERDHISADGGVEYFRAEEASVPRELELVTIDPDADYMFMPTKASRPRAPVPVTSSVGKESITLPVVIGATTRASLVTFAKYQEDNARKRIKLQTMLYGYALEPGDLFRLRDVANGFDNGEVWKVVESNHGANYINEISGEAILKCNIAFTDTDEDFGTVILLLHAESSSPLTDSSAYNETPVFIGGAHIDTGTKKFGAGSFFFDGIGDGVDIGDSEEQYVFSPTNTSPYTIELWVKLASILAEQHQILLSQRTFAQRAWVLYIPLESVELTYATSSNGSSNTATLSTSTANLGLTNWHHIAVDKDSSGTVRIYVDGVMKASDTPADSVIINSVYPISMARDGSGLNPFTGWIDDTRISAVSRYGDVYGDAGFDPPTEQFPDNVA